MKDEIKLTIAMEGGEIVLLKCDEDNWDEAYESLLNEIMVGGMFNREGWGTLKMDYYGIEISVLNCKKIIGWN